MPDIKRSPLDSYYRAYREYIGTLKNVGQFGNLKTSLRNSNKKEQDTFSGSIAHKVIDMEWVEQIESALPYIDKAIREQRRFIAQSDEIVPIAKSKKVTTESVRHLAQHTNLIGKVEEDTVTPKEILNIVREESFAIYENRFLRTLIMRSIDFVSRCYKQVKDTPESTVASITMARDSMADGQTFNVNLHCDLEYTESVREFDIADDISGMTEFERVIRLRKILSDFLSAPLIMGLAGTAEVRSPVTRTNLLTKDQNFRETLKLWEFLDRYNKVGFSLVIEENPEKMKPRMQDGIYDALTMLQFVMKMNLSDGMRQALEENYQAENERREHERKLEEEAREREVKKRIAKALADQAEAYEQKLAEADERRVAELKAQDEAWSEKHKAVVNEYENKLAEQQKRHENEIADLNEQFTDKYNSTVDHYESVIAEKDDRHAFELAEKAEQYQQYIDELNSIHEKSMEMLNNEKLAAIAECDRRIGEKEAECESRVEALTKKYESEREEEVKRAVAKFEADSRRKIAEIEKVRRETAEKLAAKTVECAAAAAGLKSANKSLSEYQRQIKAITSERKHDADILKSREDSYKKEMERMRAAYAKNISAQSQKHSKKVNNLSEQIEILEKKLDDAKRTLETCKVR